MTSTSIMDRVRRTFRRGETKTSSSQDPPASLVDEGPPNDNPAAIEKTRALVGFWVVAVGAITIGGIAGVGVVASSSANAGTIAGIIGGAIAGVSSMVSAYFGIRAASNVARHSITAPAPPST